MSTYVFAYQEWDILKEQKNAEVLKTEKYISTSTCERPAFNMILQKARIKKRMTVLDLAEKLQVSAKSISLYETGAENPSKALVDKLCEILDLIL
jgi:DNA-binding XRE family transcriptional regulator